jgi:hypothetical protein
MDKEGSLLPTRPVSIFRDDGGFSERKRARTRAQRRIRHGRALIATPRIDHSAQQRLAHVRSRRHREHQAA